jgi:hypothetical protein
MECAASRAQPQRWRNRRKHVYSGLGQKGNIMAGQREKPSRLSGASCLILGFAVTAIVVVIVALLRGSFSGNLGEAAQAARANEISKEGLLAALLERPVYAELKKFDTAGFDRLVATVFEVAERGATLEEMRGTLEEASSEIMTRYTEHYVPRATDARIFDYYQTWIAYYDLLALHSDDCYNFILSTEGVAISQTLSDSARAAALQRKDEDDRLMIAMSEGASEQPQPLNDRAAAEEVLAGIEGALSRFMPVEYEQYYQQGELPENPAAAAPICRMFSERYRLMLASEHAGDVVRLYEFPNLY